MVSLFEGIGAWYYRTVVFHHRGRIFNFYSPSQVDAVAEGQGLFSTLAHEHMDLERVVLAPDETSDERVVFEIEKIFLCLEEAPLGRWLQKVLVETLLLCGLDVIEEVCVSLFFVALHFAACENKSRAREDIFERKILILSFRDGHDDTMRHEGQTGCGQLEWLLGSDGCAVEVKKVLLKGSCLYGHVVRQTGRAEKMYVEDVVLRGLAHVCCAEDVLANARNL